MSTPFLISATDVKPVTVSWLWDGWVPAGKLVFLDGDPGCGKTTIALDLVARISSGKSMPGGEASDPCNALVISAEDEIGDTLRPRLDEAGADMARIKFLHPESPIPSFPNDSTWLANEMDTGDFKLVVLDTTMAFLGSKVDSHRDQDVRRALTPLIRAAQQSGATVLAIRHNTKSGGQLAVHRGMGSVAFSGLARAVLSVGRHPDGHSMVLAQAKCNVGKDLKSRHFTIEASNGLPTIAWGEPCDLSADDLGVMRPVSSGLVTAAKEWLTETLAEGPMLGTDVKNLAQLSEITPMTLRRAREKLAVQTSKRDKKTWWSLPNQLDQDDQG
ncbi:MAG: AAA family ATPase [Acidimicrobiia bacterium]|nr:AAA family ATPase [Acidimicrobiia bacterium]